MQRVTSVEGNTVVLLLVIDEALWQRPPQQLQVLVAGLPSPHALRGRNGARLGRPVSLCFTPQPALEASQAPRLISVGGQPLAAGLEVAFEGRVSLVFEGAIDPATVRPSACPLRPRRAGLKLSPVLPRCRWRLVGGRFELELDLGRTSGPLSLNIRELDLRGVTGEAPEPRVQVDLLAGGGEGPTPVVR